MHIDECYDEYLQKSSNILHQRVKVFFYKKQTVNTITLQKNATPALKFGREL